MVTMKRIGSLLLAFSLVLTPVMINAGDGEKDMINEDMHLIDDGINAVEIKEYINYEGYIVDVHERDGNVSIWVESQEDKGNPLVGTIFHIDGDVLLLSDDTMENIEKDYLKEGMKVLVFYSANTPMTMSLPPQATPQGVILLDSLEIQGDTEVIVLDRILLDIEANKKSIKVLENQMYVNEENILMVPLREIGEDLGYEVVWDAGKRTVELTKGAQWTELVIGEGTVGEDNYNFAKMIVKLGTPPVLKDSTTYVPVNFIEEVLQMRVDLEDGMLKIIE